MLSLVGVILDPMIWLPVIAYAWTCSKIPRKCSSTVIRADASMTSRKSW